MEALTYLQISLLEPYKREKYHWFIEKNFSKASSFHLNMFQAQPFKPEMITELFEGWEKRNFGDTGKFCYYLESDTDVMFYEFNEQNNKGVTLGGYRFMPNIKTLDAFILHCQEAGIKLTLKNPNETKA